MTCQQPFHGLSHFLFVAIASETPYHGSNEEDHLRAGSAGPILSGGPLAHARVRTLPSPWSVLHVEGVGCCWMPGSTENISSEKGPQQLPRGKPEQMQLRHKQQDERLTRGTGAPDSLPTPPLPSLCSGLVNTRHHFFMLKQMQRQFRLVLLQQCWRSSVSYCKPASRSPAVPPQPWQWQSAGWAGSDLSLPYYLN